MENPVDSEKGNDRRCVFFGFGSVAQTSVSLIIDLLSDQNISEYLIIDQHKPTKEQLGLFDYKKQLNPIPITVLQRRFEPDTLVDDVRALIQDRDMVFDLTSALNTVDVMLTIGKEKKNVVYINACIEEWEEGVDKELIAKTQYELYQRIHTKKEEINKENCTMVVDAGANPGAVTHFAVMGLYGMAQSAIDRKVADADLIASLLKQNKIPELATVLKVEVVHISELEELVPANPEYWKDRTTSSWAVDSFHEEWFVNAEVSVGSDDNIGETEDDLKKALGKDGQYENVINALPETKQTPFPMHMHSVIGKKTKYVGRLVRHPETMEISSLFWDKRTDHRVTCAFVYKPSEVTLSNLGNPKWASLPKELLNETTAGPLQGQEAMGATLISSRIDIPARWYGSIVTCEESRRVQCPTNPTALQVAAGAVAHMVLACRHPDMGVVMPHDFESRETMEIMKPYLGTIVDEDVTVSLPTKWSELLADDL